MSAKPIALRVVEALSSAGTFISTASLAAGLKVGRHQVVAAYDEIEASGLRLMRIRDVGGGVELLD